MPFCAQWIRYYIRKHRNFDIRTTSGTEVNNSSIKSYLFNGMGHVFKLVEVIENMFKDQQKVFEDKYTVD
jgi:hypothetical protein